MIFDLSKNKSLAGLLKRVELDEETKKLVNQGASATLIKMSLVKNMNSSNIVQYRRYIQKAEEEETEQQRIARERKEMEPSLEDEKDTTLEETTEEALQSKLGQKSKEEKERLGQKTKAQIKEERLKKESKYKKQQSVKKKLARLQRGADSLRAITSNLDTVKTPIRLKEFEVMVGTGELGKSLSNELIEMLQILKKNKKGLVEAYEYVLTKKYTPYSKRKNKRGEFIAEETKENQFVPLKRKKGEKGEVPDYVPDETKVIDVPALQDQLLSYLEVTFPVKDKEETMDIIEVLALMHKRKFNEKASSMVDKRQEKTFYESMQQLFRGGSPREKLGFEKAKKNVNSIKKYTEKLLKTKRNLEESIEDLEDLKKDSAGLMKRKVKTIKNAIRIMLKNKKGVLRQPTNYNPETGEREGVPREGFKRTDREIMQGRLKRQFKETIELSFGISMEKLDFPPMGFGEEYEKFIDKLAEDTLEDINDEIDRAKVKLEYTTKRLTRLGFTEDTSGQLPLNQATKDYIRLVRRLTDDEGEMIPAGKSAVKILIKANKQIAKLDSLSRKVTKEFVEYFDTIESIISEAIREKGFSNEMELDDEFERHSFTQNEKYEKIETQFNELVEEVIDIVRQAEEEFATISRDLDNEPKSAEEARQRKLSTEDKLRERIKERAPKKTEEERRKDGAFQLGTRRIDMSEIRRKEAEEYTRKD